jgi:hypothetical protein
MSSRLDQRHAPRFAGPPRPSAARTLPCSPVRGPKYAQLGPPHDLSPCEGPRPVPVRLGGTRRRFAYAPGRPGGWSQPRLGLPGHQQTWEGSQPQPAKRPGQKGVPGVLRRQHGRPQGLRRSSSSPRLQAVGSRLAAGRPGPSGDPQRCRRRRIRQRHRRPRRGLTRRRQRETPTATGRPRPAQRSRAGRRIFRAGSPGTGRPENWPCPLRSDGCGTQTSAVDFACAGHDGAESD